MRVLYTICFILFSLSIGISQVDKAEGLYSEANKLIAEGNIDEGISKYREIEEMGLSSTGLYFNLGTSYLNVDNISYAVLYLEKAHKSDPSNNDIKHNLEIARSRIDSDLVEVPDFILLRIWRGISSTFTPFLWFIFQIIFGVAFVFGIYTWKLRDSSRVKLKGFALALGSLILLLFSISAGFTADKMVNESDSAILMKAVALKSGADDRSDTLASLSQGVKLKINDKIGDWYKVQLINKEEGWIKVSDVHLI